MRLTQLVVKNFMPYYGEHVVDFPRDGHRNVMIVIADNMRGKTSLLNALRFAFYGSILDRREQEIPLHLVANRDAADAGDWDFSVTVRFETNEHVYELQRSAQKKYLAPIARSSADYDIVEGLKEDGVPLTRDDMEHRLSGIAPKAIQRFFLFDGELLQDYEELLDDRSHEGARIKAAIEQVLGVPALTNGRDQLNVLTREAQKTQASEAKHNENFRGVAERQEALGKDIAILERDISDLKQQFRNADVECREHIAFLEAHALEEEQQRKLVALRSAQQTSQDALEKYSTDRLELLSQAWSDLLSSLMRDHERHLLHEHERLTQERRNQVALEEKVKDLRALLEMELCGTCEQPLGQEYRGKVGHKLGDLESALLHHRSNDEAAAEVFEKLKRLQSLRGRGVGSAIRTLDQSIAAKQVELARIKSQILEIEQHLESADEAEFQRRRSLRDGLLRHQGELRATIEARERDLKRKNADYETNSRILSKGSGATGSRAMKRVVLSKALEHVFAASVDRLRDDLRERVEQHATEAFTKLTTQKAYKSLRINENYGLTILDDKGDRVEVRSAGAEQIVALSLIAGLNRTGRPIGPIVMDTPFGRLDPKHRSHVFSYYPDVATQFILFVHEGELNIEEVQGSPIAARVDKVYRIRPVSSRRSEIVTEGAA